MLVLCTTHGTTSSHAGQSSVDSSLCWPDILIPNHIRALSKQPALQLTTRQAASCRVVSCHAVSCHVMSCYHALPLATTMCQCYAILCGARHCTMLLSRFQESSREQLQRLRPSHLGEPHVPLLPVSHSSSLHAPSDVGSVSSSHLFQVLQAFFLCSPLSQIAMGSLYFSKAPSFAYEALLPPPSLSPSHSFAQASPPLQSLQSLHHSTTTASLWLPLSFFLMFMHFTLSLSHSLSLSPTQSSFFRLATDLPLRSWALILLASLPHVPPLPPLLLPAATSPPLALRPTPAASSVRPNPPFSARRVPSSAPPATKRCPHHRQPHLHQVTPFCSASPCDVTC